MRNKSLLLVVAFLFRLGFGLSASLQDPDATQIYLLGLKFYTTHAWPYFGPDVIWGEVQIPGALQGILVGLPLFLLPIPEAPYLLLNVLSFAMLCLFAWYCCRRLPELPRWLIWTWLLTCPWTMNLSTQVYNPSYLLVAGIAFFVGAIEIYPATTAGLIDKRVSNLMMGFAIGWAMQLHLSWTILVPYALLALGFQIKEGVTTFTRRVAFFSLGLAVPLSLWLPTILKYGIGAGGTRSAILFNRQNLVALPGIFRRTLSLASFDITNFIGGHTADRIAFLKAQPWMVPVVIFLLAISAAQAVALVITWFKNTTTERSWRGIKYLAVVNVLMIYFLFLFSVKPPQSNHVYLTFPIPMLYSLYCWQWLLNSRRRLRLAKIALVCGILFHAGLAFQNVGKGSVISLHRQIQQAIDNRDYTILGERRPHTLY